MRQRCRAGSEGLFLQPHHRRGGHASEPLRNRTHQIACKQQTPSSSIYEQICIPSSATLPLNRILPGILIFLNFSSLGVDSIVPASPSPPILQPFFENSYRTCRCGILPLYHSQQRRSSPIIESRLILGHNISSIYTPLRYSLRLKHPNSLTRSDTPALSFYLRIDSQICDLRSTAIQIRLEERHRIFRCPCGNSVAVLSDTCQRACFLPHDHGIYRTLYLP